MPTNYDLLNRALPRIGFRAEVVPAFPHFLQDVVFGGRDILGNEGSNIIGIDYKRIAPGISEEAVFGLDPNRVNYKTGFSEKFLQTAYFFDEDIIDFNDAEARVFGEDLGQNKGNFARILSVTADKRDALIAGQRLALEKLCAEVLLSGKATIKGGEQTFPMKSDLLGIAGANLLKKPVETLAGAVKTLHNSNGNAAPRYILMNQTDAINLLTAAEKYLAKDSWNTGSAVFAEYDANGVVFDGRLAIPGAGVMEIYHYDGAVAGADLIPQGKAVILPYGGRVGSKGYSRVMSADNQMNIGIGAIAKERTTVFPSGEGDMKVTKIQQQSAPLPIITAIDGYGVITGIPASIA